MSMRLREFEGTMIPIVLGGSVMKEVFLAESNKQLGGWLIITIACRVAVFEER